MKKSEDGNLGVKNLRRTDNTMAKRYQREVIRICKSKKNRQHNGQMKKNKWTNNDLQNTTQKTKD
jgi:hypothetical protein